MFVLRAVFGVLMLSNVKLTTRTSYLATVPSMSLVRVRRGNLSPRDRGMFPLFILEMKASADVFA